MQNLKERKPLLFKILTGVVLVIMCCLLPKIVFDWGICRVLVDYGDWWLDSVCPDEVVEQWYENLFWEDCARQDKQIPPNTEVLISACTNPEVRGVPGGEVLFVHEAKTGEIYLLDLRTGEKKQVPDDPLLLERGIFLSSELVWLRGSSVGPGANGYRPHYILDLTNGQRYELLDLTLAPLKNGDFDIQNYRYIKSAEQVFLHHSKNELIALAPNFRQDPKQNVILSQYSLEFGANSEHGEVLVQLMRNLEVNYEIVDLSLQYVEVFSPTGKYIASTDGIFLSGADTPLIPGEYTRGYYAGKGGSFISWYYDESGIVFTQGEYYYIQDSLYGSHFPLPRPILKMKLPVP
ncbi:MAG: hypothetical protein HZB18_18255 [Chloroflexi bacterium]|nr:hypothetical protein [Chloroflexota bacterium]